MKNVFAILLFALLASTATAQNRQVLQPETADTCLYVQNPDGTWGIFASTFYPAVADSTKKKIELSRVSLQLNLFADFEKRFKAQQKQLRQDSIKLAQAIKNINPNDLYRADLESLAGVWKLTIADKTDELTVDSLGTFTSKKSGGGTITVLADGAKKIRLTLAASKIPLTREGENLFENEELKTRFKRVIADKTKR